MALIKFGKGDKQISPWSIVILIVGLLAGMGGIYYGWAQAIANADHTTINERLRQIDNEDANQNSIIVANTGTISDIKTEVTDRLGRIEATLIQIEKRLR